MIRMSRILFLTDYFPLDEKVSVSGGVENRYFNLVKGLSVDNDVTVMCSCQDKSLVGFDEVVFGARIVCPGFMAYTNRGVFNRLLLQLQFFFRALRLGFFDVIVGTNFVATIPAFVIAKIKRCKSVGVWHECWINDWVKNKGLVTGLFGEVWERLSIKLRYDKLVSVSEFTAKKMSEHCKNRISIISNGVNNSLMDNFIVNKDTNKSLVVVGRLTKTKNVDLIIRAFKDLIKDYPDLKLKIVGTGPELEPLTNLANKLGLKDNTRFYGFVKEHNDVLKIIKESHIYVSASELEGFGITLLEGMSAGLPIICSKIPPFLEVTKKKALYFDKQLGYDYVNNKFYKKGLIDCIKELLTNKEHYETMSKEMKKVAKEYDWKNITIKWKQKIL